MDQLRFVKMILWVGLAIAGLGIVDGLAKMGGAHAFQINIVDSVYCGAVGFLFMRVLYRRS